MEALNRQIVDSAVDAITLAIKLTGPMVLFLGLMNVAREGGLLTAIARGLAPLMRRLFPDVPADHPAMGAMIMNMASNAMGLGNAATPFGLKAMAELARIAPRPGIASDSMVLFLAINTSSITLLPTGVIALRAAAGSENAAAIFPTTVLATLGSTLGAVAACFALRRLRGLRLEDRPDVEVAAEPGAPAHEPPPDVDVALPSELPPLAPPATRWALRAFWLAFGVALVLHVRTLESSGLDAFLDVMKSWLLAALVAFLLWFGVRRRVRVYEAAVAGGKEGLEVAVRIAPYLVAILVAVGMLRASGALAALVAAIEPWTSAVGIPAEAMPMALLRPLSGSGAYGVMAEILQTHGPDSFVGYVVSTLQGSTETTFYVLALYLGAAKVRDGRHSLPACLVGDFCGLVAAVAACHWFFA
jgi:spore maturation protein SpmA/spore maturation protein SpmB